MEQPVQVEMNIGGWFVLSAVRASLPSGAWVIPIYRTQRRG